MILAFDTSTAACTAALFDGTGACIGQADEVIGRGHSERLVPMLAELLRGRAAERILVGVGPGSFTGLRVAIAAAHGLAIGWNAEVLGLSSLALIAAASPDDGPVATAMTGGHGELFVQEFDGATLEPLSAAANLAPGQAAEAVRSDLVLGPGAARLVEARGYGVAREAWPSAANALALPVALRSLPPRPIYGRAPDARLPQAA